MTKIYILLLTLMLSFTNLVYAKTNLTKNHAQTNKLNPKPCSAKYDKRLSFFMIEEDPLGKKRLLADMNFYAQANCPIPISMSSSNNENINESFIAQITLSPDHPNDFASIAIALSIANNKPEKIVKNNAIIFPYSDAFLDRLFNENIEPSLQFESDKRKLLIYLTIENEKN